MTHTWIKKFKMAKWFFTSLSSSSTAHDLSYKIATTTTSLLFMAQETALKITRDISFSGCHYFSLFKVILSACLSTLSTGVIICGIVIPPDTIISAQLPVIWDEKDEWDEVLIKFKAKWRFLSHFLTFIDEVFKCKCVGADSRCKIRVICHIRLMHI